MAMTPDGRVSPLIETEEETRGPLALVGRETVALLVGSPPNQVLALVSANTGQIERRLEDLPRSVDAVAGAPGGGTLFYAADGQVVAVDLQSGESRLLHQGDAVAVDPAGEYAVVALREQEGIRLVKVFLADGQTEDIPNRSEFAIANGMLSSNAVGSDGRIAVQIAPVDLWYWPTGILDPRTGQIERAWPEIDADMFGNNVGSNNTRRN